MQGTYITVLSGDQLGIGWDRTGIATAESSPGRVAVLLFNGDRDRHAPDMESYRYWHTIKPFLLD